MHAQKAFRRKMSYIGRQGMRTRVSPTNDAGRERRAILACTMQDATNQQKRPPTTTRPRVHPPARSVHSFKISPPFIHSRFMFMFMFIPGSFIPRCIRRRQSAASVPKISPATDARCSSSAADDRHCSAAMAGTHAAYRAFRLIYFSADGRASSCADIVFTHGKSKLAADII